MMLQDMDKVRQLVATKGVNPFALWPEHIPRRFIRLKRWMAMRLERPTDRHATTSILCAKQRLELPDTAMRRAPMAQAC